MLLSFHPFFTAERFYDLLNTEILKWIDGLGLSGCKS